MKNRDGEKVRSWFRSERFFLVDGQWFFNTRENDNMGPYSSKSEALRGLSLYVDSMALRNGSLQPAKSSRNTRSRSVGGVWSAPYYH